MTSRSTAIGRSWPSGRISRSASTRSSRVCATSGMSPISSRNRIPPSASCTLPRTPPRRRGGVRGKVQLADGGILFLDEIGDMPLVAQTRLLRVLAEREILPLGHDRPIAVDLDVICATHQDLERLGAQ